MMLTRSTIPRTGIDAMPDHSDLIARLRAACVGHPSASIAWPHRILHEAASALSSQPLSLSEAREEIERSELGRHRLGHALREATRQRDEALEALRKIHNCGQSAEPDHWKFRCMARDVARKALENGPAVLADATTNPPLSDLSSLRKGAEVAVKPLEWVTHDPDCWYARCPVSSKEYYVIREDGRWWATWDLHIPAFETAEEGKSAAQSDFETRIRSALVSGSREDGDG